LRQLLKVIVLEIASLLIGITSIVPLILPLAASLSAHENRVKVVGLIMSGLLVGLLSRTLSGLIGEVGWRTMFSKRLWAQYVAVLYQNIQLNFPFSGSIAHWIPILLSRVTLAIEATLDADFLALRNLVAFWTTMCCIICFLQF
jgi:hypothetical protein